MTCERMLLFVGIGEEVHYGMVQLYSDQQMMCTRAEILKNVCSHIRI